MPRRLAIALALVVFAVCMLCGMAANNTFTETVKRSLLAMATTAVIGGVIGAMAGRLLEENVKQVAKKASVSETKPPTEDR